MTLSQFPARFGKYILLDRLNAGGMAEVFRAKVTGVEGFERLVAIKCMLPQLVMDEQFIGMFIDEARLAAQVSHANVVQIYELGRQAERLYIAMELVNGRDLRHILRTAKASETQIPASFAAYVIAKAAEGLDFAHRKAGVDGLPLNLVHRDVSPQNILVTYDGEVKVVDFGIAKASAQARSTETQAGVLKGKFAYMAPEQVAGDIIDRRADIFSLGSVLFEVATGQRLFSGDNDLAVLEKVRDVQIPDLHTALPPQAQSLADVLRRALAQKPDARFGYASEMAEGLEEQLIEDRSIFGAKRAAQVMRALYADEVAELVNTLKRYAAVTADKCIVTIGKAEAVPGGQSSDRAVYESTFDEKTGETPLQTNSSDATEMALSRADKVIQRRAPPKAAGHTSMLPAGPRVVLSKHTQIQSAGAGGLQPVTGAGTRPRQMQPKQPSTVNTNLTPQKHLNLEFDTDKVPRLQQGGAAQVLRQLTRLSMLALVITFGLVLLVRWRGAPDAHQNGIFAQLGQLQSLQTCLKRVQAVKPWLAERLLGTSFENTPVPPPQAISSTPQPSNNAQLAGPKSTLHSYLSLKIRGAPGGHVFMDNKDLGTAPVMQLRLTTGVHTLRVIEAGGNGRSRTVSIKLGPQHTQTTPLNKVVVLPWTQNAQQEEE